MAARKSSSTDVETPAEKEMVVLSHSSRQQSVAAVTTLSELRTVFGTTEIEWSDIEPSFDVVDQETFESMPLVIGAFRFNESKKFLRQANPEDPNSPMIPSEFVSMLVAAYDPESETFTTPWVIVNDGGTGIKDQLNRYAARFDDDPRQAPPLKASKGFRRSDYSFETTDSKGKATVGSATTWYIG